MNMKHVLSTFLLALAVCLSATAQQNPGADYLSLGELDLAKNYFMKTMRQSPADSYYYLGEMAFQDGKIEEAKSNYEKGLAGNPESILDQIGLAKVQLKSNPKVAEDLLSSIQKKNKKDVSVILAIAKAYADNDMIEKAMAKIADARKADKKSPYSYIMEGDVLAKQGKMGDAGQWYDQAVFFDPNCVIAYLKGAKVYETINPNTSISMLKKAVEIDPNYMIAYKYMGKIYSGAGFFPEAIEAYKKYFTTGNQTVEDIRLYAGDEYYLKNYAEVKRLVEEGLQRDQNNFVLNRLLMYSANDLKEYPAALEAGSKFFALTRGAGVNYIPQDHKTYANVLTESGQKAEAIGQYKLAIALEPDNVDAYKEVAGVCSNADMPEEAANFHKMYIEKKGEAAEATDYFQLGRYYYTAGGTMISSEDPAVKAKGEALLKQADAAFGTVSERIPESHLGYFFRARVNAAMDPETTLGLARPYYEDVVKVVTAKDDHNNNKELIESYRYLAYYYYLQSIEGAKTQADKDNVKKYCTSLLELDPENSVGKQLLDAVK